MMDIKDEALKMAIEAMEDVAKNCGYWEMDMPFETFEKLIGYCKQALEGKNT
jgi:hypothetical protein